MNSQHKKHQSPRLEYFDYSNPGAYFITIVTKSSIPFFGKLHQGKSLLSKEGMIAEEIWKKIPEQFPFAAIDEWIIMPNHMHGIVVIKNKLNFIDSNSSNVFEKDTIYEKMKDNSGGLTGEKNPMLKDGLGKIIRWYKGRTKFEVGKENEMFGWHHRYYEKIISNQAMMERIRQYIRRNPSQ